MRLVAFAAFLVGCGEPDAIVEYKDVVSPPCVIPDASASCGIGPNITDCANGNEHQISLTNSADASNCQELCAPSEYGAACGGPPPNDNATPPEKSCVSVVGLPSGTVLFCCPKC